MLVRVLSFIVLCGFYSNAYSQAKLQDLAEQAANLIGVGREGLCTTCHATSSERTLERWAEATRRVELCLENNTAPEKLACIGQQELDESFMLHAGQLGFYSAAVHLEPITALIRESFDLAQANSILESLQSDVLMPLHSERPMSLAEFDTVKRWVLQGMPYLNDLLEHEHNTESSCKQSFDDALTDLVVTMKHDGWRSRNQSEGLAMFACSGDGTCFRQQRDGQDIFPDVASDGNRRSWKFDPLTEMRSLTEINGNSIQYWIRSSPDGRFVGFGGRPSGIIDLQSLLAPEGTPRVISVNALYDPGFFPDSSGFMFQDRFTGLCNMSILRNSNTTTINFREDACLILNRNNRIPLYQALGASLDGDDYLAVTSSYLRDAGTASTMGEHMPSEDIAVASSNSLHIHPFAFDGETWVRRARQSFSTPFEVDWVLSNSNNLLISRGQIRQDGIVRSNGYNLYQLSKDSNGSYQKDQIGRLCVDGLKGDFSFDERFFVTYSYIRPDHWRLLGFSSANDPEFQRRLRTGSANIFLFDLYTKRRYTITSMGANQYALFPHFRSDGWIYFEVYDSESQTRTVLTSNAAVRAETLNQIP